MIIADLRKIVDLFHSEYPLNGDNVLMNDLDMYGLGI